MRKVFISFLTLVGCAASSPESENYHRLARITNKQIEREMPLSDDGAGAMIPDKIHAYSTIFEYNGPFPIDLGRMYVLRISQIVLNNFNSDNRIQEYLENRPFTVKNLAFSIYSSSWFDYAAPENFIDCVGFSYGLIYYKRYDHVIKKFEILFTETYEEALQKCPLFYQSSALQ